MVKFEGFTYYNQEEMEEMTVAVLRGECARYGLSRYSKANKPTLINMLSEYFKNAMMELTANDLRAVASDLGYTGISKTNKTNLIALIEDYRDSDDSDEEMVDLGDDDGDIMMAPSDNSPVNNENNDSEKIKVIFSAKTRTIEAEGKSVWEIHADLESTMGMPHKPSFLVNKVETSNNYVPVAGDTVEFFKVEPGNKG